MTELSQKASMKTMKSTESKKVFSCPKDQTLSRKRQRKADHPIRIQSPESEQPNSWVCKNSGCKATLSTFFDSFCKRCSCCICHSFDNNKDPSLWLECSSKYDEKDSCGLSCHVECALRKKKVGVINLEPVMQSDGIYCCAHCGKVSGIIRYWKDQMNLAKDARRVDTLCYRLFLCYRLLKGTSKFKEMQDIVKEAIAKLETEVGPVNGFTALHGKGLVNRLSVGAAVQNQCSLAIEKAEEWLSSTTLSNTKPIFRDGSLPAACRFLFEEVNSTSVVIVLIELPNEASEEIKGYKLWYCKSRGEKYDKEPNSVFTRSQRKFLISNLKPCTEYAFRIISYTDEGNLGHSEAKCFTKSVEIIHKNPNSNNVSNNRRTEPDIDSRFTTHGFRVRNIGKILNMINGHSGIEHKSEKQSVLRDFDLNVSSVPDLNEEAVLPHEEAERNGGGDSDCLLGTGTNGSGSFDEYFEYNVKIIRWLEQKGYIDKEFRLNLLTWFGLRSTEQGRRIVNSYIQTMLDDPSSLAAQLVNSFSEIVSNKRQRIDPVAPFGIDNCC